MPILPWDAESRPSKVLDTECAASVERELDGRHPGHFAPV